MTIYMQMTSEPTDPFEFCGRIYPKTGESYPVSQPPITITSTMPMIAPYNFSSVSSAVIPDTPKLYTPPPPSLEELQTRIDKNAQNIQTLQTSVRMLNTYIRMNPEQHGLETTSQTELRELIESVRIMKHTANIRLRQATYIGMCLTGAILCGIVYGTITQFLS